MPTYNYKARELIAKIVYYGPGRCGKTTNLQQIHARMRPETRSELLSVATETDRTIYFDLLPLNLGTISGMKFMVRLFTVPGQVYYSETRRLVLRGADAVVFVADSQDHMLDENRQSLQDLKENLAANNLDYKSIPLVFQYNKRDLSPLTTEAELDSVLNERGAKHIPAIASQGEGVLETLRHITLGVFNHIKSGGLHQKGQAKARPVSAGPSPQPRAASAPSPIMAGSAPKPAPVKPGSWMASMPRTNFAGADEGLGADNRPPPPGAPLAAGGAAMQTDSTRSPAPPPPPPPAAPYPPVTQSGNSSSIPVAPVASAPSIEREAPSPARIEPGMVLEEFKNLAVMQSKMAERLAALEHELARLGRENQEIREILARQSQP